MERGLGPWAVFALFLISSSVVLGVEWKKECDGGLRTWLLTAVCVTAVCGILGVMFNGRGEGSGPSRFLGTDDDCDDDCEDIDAGGGDSVVDSRRRVGMGLGPSCDTSRVLPVLSEEGCSTVKGGDGNKGMVTEDGNGNGMVNGTGHEDGKDEDITSAHGSSVSVQFASRAASSLQRQYFGPGPKVYPDAVFLVLVVSQWFLAAWSMVGAVLYFRIFERGRSCSPLLRHWTLLVVIIGFLSCLLAVCYSGIMCCMLGTPIYRRRRGRDELRSEASTDSSVGSKSGPTGSMI